MRKLGSGLILLGLALGLLAGCQSMKKVAAWPKDAIGNLSPTKKPPPLPPEIITPKSKTDIQFSIQQYQAGHHLVAEYYLKKALFVSPDNPQAIQLLPWTYFFQKKYDRALVAFANGHAHFPRDPQPLVGMGWSYFAMQFYEKALETFEKAREREPDSFQVLKGIAFCHLFLKRVQQAEVILGKIYTYREKREVLAHWEKWQENMPTQLPEIAPVDTEALSLFTIPVEAPRFTSLLYSLPGYKPHPRLDTAWEAYRKQRYHKALRAFYKLPSEMEETLDALNGLAWSLLKTGEILEAQKVFRKILVKYPGFIGAVRGSRTIQTTLEKKARFAQYYFDLKKLAIAETKFQELTDRYPRWSHPWGMLGWIELKRGEEQNAKNLFDHALSLDPQDKKSVQGMRQLRGLAVADLFKGDQALAGKDYKTASYHYFDFIQEQSHLPEINAPLAQAYSGLGFSQIGKRQYQMALKNFEKLAVQKEFQLEYAKGMGLAHYHLGKFELAAQFLIQADALKPDQLDVTYPLDWSILRSWDKDTAREYFMEKTQTHPKRASSYMGLGWIYYKNGDPDLGVEYFLKATSLDPKIAHSDEFTAMLDKERFGWQVYNHLGWAYYFKKEYNRSIDMFQVALETRPRSSEAMKGLGYTYFRLEQFGQAETILKKCIKRNPNTHPVIETRTTDEPGAVIQVNTSARTMLARILFQQEKYQEALIPLLEELERHPDWAEIHNSLGWTYIKLNRLTESRDSFLQAIQQQPLNSPAHKGLRKVKYLMALKKM